MAEHYTFTLLQSTVCYRSKVFCRSSCSMPFCQQKRIALASLRYWSGVNFYTVIQKKGATITMATTLSILDRFAKFFHCCKEHYISNKTVLGYLLTVEQRISNIWRNVSWSVVWCPTQHYRHCSWPVEKGSPLSRHVFVQMMDIWNTFCEQTLANN